MRRVDGAGKYLGGALLVSLIGLGFFLAQLQSNDIVTWTGRCVPATEQGGLAYYTVNGQPQAVNDPIASASAPTTAVTVCYDPAQPDQGMVLHPLTHAFEATLVGGPLLVALVILLFGFVIKPRRLKDIDAEVPWPAKRG